MFSVTSVGTHEMGPLTDSLHGYYLGILRTERFKEEVDQARIEVTVPDNGCKSVTVDCCTYCCKLLMAFITFTLAMFLVGFLMTGEAQDTYLQVPAF